jgi:glycopeptide antibiotics resistance protein
MRVFLKYHRNALIWAFLILVLCTMPVSGIEPFKLLNLFSFDKVIHMVLFAFQFWFLVIGIIKQRTFSYKRKRSGRLAFIITIIYGAIIELLQGYVLENRTMDVMDMIANIVGAGIGWLMFYYFKRKVRPSSYSS